VTATSPMVEGNMSKFEIRIVHSTLEESPCWNTCVLLRRESIVATLDPSLSLSLLRDEQRVSLGSLLMVVLTSFFSTYQDGQEGLISRGKIIV
jgi:hypothetical protein